VELAREHGVYSVARHLRLDYAGLKKRLGVPVDAIARTAGLDVRYAPTTDEVSGALIRNGKTAVIAVNSAQHENRQRFTIAHEIGHFILHKRAQRHFDEDFRIDYRNALSSEATRQDEIEANRFAATLLMPESFLRRDLSRIEADDCDTDYVIQTLSVRYKVSRRAMELRLLNLGFIPPM
jgi:Zn-dependent peptidase ImmA (M78 family)